MSSIHYSEQGKGQPVIFIHGFCEIGEMWEALAVALSNECRVIYPDLPGFGKSPLKSDSISLEEVAVELEDWLDTARIEQPILVGHSLGGYVALALLELMGERIKGVCLLHSTSFADDESKKESRNKALTFLKKHGVDKFVTSFVPPLFSVSAQEEFQEEIQLAVDQAKQSNLNGLLAFTKAMRDRKARLEVLQNFRGPKMLIAGTEDSAVPIEASRRQKSAFTDYHELDKVGHMGQVERKNEVINLLRGFIRKN